MLESGQVLMAWVTLMQQFGRVEVLGPWGYDVGDLRRIVAKTPLMFLAVCVEPVHRSYDGRLVVLRYDERNRCALVLAVDNYGVLYAEDGGEEAFCVRAVPAGVPESSGPMRASVSGDVVHVSGAASDVQELSDGSFCLKAEAEPIVPATRPFSVRIRSYKHGNAEIECDAAGVIVNASGEYGRYYVGMPFDVFIRGFKKADKGMRYRRI